jgi:type II secretory pathway pseudopilin PulG
MNGDGDEGSVFIEALVATAIVAMVLTATFQLAADSAIRRRGLEARREALMTAQSELAAVGSEIPLSPGAVEGSDGARTWRVEMQPCGGGGSAAGRLYCVDVSVRSTEGGAPLASLSSRRLAPRS